MKRLCIYLTGSVVLIILLYIGAEIQLALKAYFEKYFKLMPQVTFTVFFPILIGIIIRFPQLVKEIKIKKRWSIDWIKLTAIGIPSLYIALLPLLYFSNIPFYNQIFALTMVSSGSMQTAIAGVIFGYIILDSLKEK
ncbi:hypothetical protein ACQKCU_02485 [Heyndrickxia sporothermodurans]